MKRTCQSTDRLSATEIKGQQRAPLLVLCQIQTHVAQHTATHFHYWAIKKMMYQILILSIIISCNLEPIFCMQDFMFGLLKSNIEVRQDTI